MTLSYAKLVEEAFVNLGPKNPLKRLSDQDKDLLVACLVLHSFDHVEVGQLFERAANVAGEARKLAARIRHEVLGGKVGRVLAPLLKDSAEDLAAQLEAFSKMEILLSQLVGKPGHKGETQRNQYLVMASELVSLRLGKHYNEHLAELIQNLSFDTELTADEDISGESIRKKREYFEENYPVLYKNALEKIRCGRRR